MRLGRLPARSIAAVLAIERRPRLIALALDPGFGLQHGADRGGVVIGVTAFERRRIDRQRCRKQRRRHAHFPGEGADHVHVLLPHRAFHGDVAVVVLHHHRRAQLEHPRIARAVGDHLEDHFRIEPGLHAHHHGFRRGNVVDRDQEIGDIFHLAAVAEGADVVKLAREAAEHRLDLRHRFGIAAGVDHQIARPRLGAGAAHRAIEHDVAGGAEHLLGLLLVVDREGRAFGDDPARQFCSCDLLSGGRQSLGLRQTGDDDGRSRGDRLGAAGDLDAGLGQFPAFCRVDVETDHSPSRRDKIARERAAHDAEADHAHSLFRFLRTHSSAPNCRFARHPKPRRTLAQDREGWEWLSAPAICTCTGRTFMTRSDRLSSGKMLRLAGRTTCDSFQERWATPLLWPH